MHRESLSPRTTLGFSLVELSIVLVILGLLTGGILSGQSLIRAAEIRSIATDFARYRAAVYTFRDKYFALPGDMTNATAFWGAADGNDGIGTDCSTLTAASSGTLTCNGNGDGRISGIDPCTDGYERYRAWQHLQNAGLIQGKLSGTLDPTYAAGSYPCRTSVVGSNTPRSRITTAGFDMLYRPGTINLFWNNDTNYIMFGAQQVISGSIVELEGATIKPEEAWNIDTKMDDGLPITGAIKTYPNGWFGKYCANTANTAYDLTTTSIQCALALQL